ncbi:hypothetical protein J5Y03_00725 [Bacillus sp. RG28]|uniref:Anti-sigma factor RsgI-like middle domain-containing protein n=1 Tax=Gottfriedia endophytica TaxID=2820819 RepID=A0A940NK73_9BACI|nr:hypothetical protein [Gottfriedia endophytica]MBP0723704.1 hypothetical protein [Gottfriedia endophytica]
MNIRFKSAMDRVTAEEDLIRRTEFFLKEKLNEKSNQTNVVKSTRRKFMMNKWIAVAATTFLAISGGALGYKVYEYKNTPVSYVSLDINPSVEISVNASGDPVDVESYNQDGTTILKGIDVKGKSLKKAVSELVLSAVNNQFIEADGSTVVSVTTETDDKTVAKELGKDAEMGVNEALKISGKTVTIEKNNIALSNRIEAKKLGISPGKLNLIHKLQELDPAISVDDYRYAKVKDIMAAIHGKEGKAVSDNPLNNVNEQNKNNRDQNNSQISDQNKDDDNKNNSQIDEQNKNNGVQNNSKIEDQNKNDSNQQNSNDGNIENDNQSSNKSNQNSKGKSQSSGNSSTKQSGQSSSEDHQGDNGSQGDGNN